MQHAVARFALAAAISGLAAWAVLPAAADPAAPSSPATSSAHSVLDSDAQAFVTLVLEYGTYEPLEVDAYYGPRALADAATAHPRPLAQLAPDAEALRARIQATTVSGDSVARKRYLLAQLTALRTRILIKQGRRFSFVDEAERLYGARPTLHPLESYDGLLAQIDRLVPGDGPLNERLVAYRKLMNAPSAKAADVIGAAIRECRARLGAHRPPPGGVIRFDLRERQAVVGE
jgi:hypothetical protein